LRIEITKRIAPGGGLGGGSSNAATVLRALNSMWNLGLEPARLMDVARTLGADVPYFLVGGPALGLGRGDQIHAIALPLEYRVLLVQGAGSVSTGAVFKQFAALGKQSAGRSRIDRFLGGSAAIAALRNDLEPAALLVSPALDRVRRHVLKVARDTGARKAAMSGSGSSFFLLFDDAKSRRMAKAALEGLALRSLACAFVTRKSFRDRFVAEPA
jgi:4-diphosphocytidyl-2-C-methyl-D-erythritol kinase